MLKPTPYTNWKERYQLLQAQTENTVMRAYYSDELPQADAPVADVPLVAMDFETTGLDAQNSEILSIGLVPFSSQRIFCADARHWILQPKHSLPDESVVIHGITHNVVDQAPEFGDIFATLFKALAGKVIVVHYRNIEHTFLQKACLNLIGERPAFPMIDTMELERRALEGRRGLLDRLMRKPLGSLRLADARERYSLPAYSAHHALTDAIATAELFQAQLAYHYRPDTAVGELWQ